MKDLDLSIFPTISKENWGFLAEKQLKGEDPNQVLKWQNTADIDLLGYYDESDIESLSYLAEFFKNLAPHRWKLYQQIEVDQDKEANRQILEALMGGCDGVILNLKSPPSWDVLLKEIDHTICDIGTNSNFEINTSDYTGPHSNEVNGNALIIKEVHNPVKQLVEAISQVEKHVYILRSSLKDFFLEIASIRALRYLLRKKGLDTIHIHTTIPLHESNEHQWFLNTTAGLASILGGSHSIDLPTAIGDERISRNTANLIREESGIEEYVDQCGGAYYVEFLTDRIIKAASTSLN